VLQTFASDRALGQEFHLQSLVTVVDAVAGAENLANMAEARHQAALADRIVLTKTDLAHETAVEDLTGHLRKITAAPIAAAVNGRIDPDFLLEEAPDLPARDLSHDHPHAHSDGIDSFVLEFPAPLPWPVFEQAMAVLTALRGPDLLRVKGLVAVEGCRGPVVVHAVQHLAHRPVELEGWPEGDRRSRLVFIARNLAKTDVERLFAAVASIGTTTPARGAEEQS
jgi:G3E family GTPase